MQNVTIVASEDLFFRSLGPSHPLLSLISPLSHSTLSPGLQDFSSSPTSGWDSPLGTTPVKVDRLFFFVMSIE